MPLMIHHLLREVQKIRGGRPVPQAEVEAYAREVLPLAQHNVRSGLERLAGAGLVDRLTVDKFTGEEREVWSARGDAPVEVVAARHPDPQRSQRWFGEATGGA